MSQEQKPKSAIKALEDIREALDGEELAIPPREGQSREIPDFDHPDFASDDGKGASFQELFEMLDKEPKHKPKKSTVEILRDIREGR